MIQAGRFDAARTRQRHAVLLTAVILAVGVLVRSGPAWAESANHHPVKVVADQRLPVVSNAGTGMLPLYVSRDWSRPLAGVTRAVIIIHGYLRNADVYNATAEKALSAAGPTGEGTILVTPQFLAGIDVAAHDLPADTLRWSLTGWEAGDNALAPVPISSFAALDAILARLGDHERFPNLKAVVIAGHSGGAQVVQRYAILGRGGAALAASGIGLRYVVANPLSYAYFSADRPDGKSDFAPFDASSCPGFNHWKYGMVGLPPYAGGANPTALESDYVARDVVYLLGTADTDPHHPALDRSCMGEAEGPYRLARGLDYFRYLQARDGARIHQHLFLVPEVGHDGLKMLTSACGLAALFDRLGCPTAKP